MPKTPYVYVIRKSTVHPLGNFATTSDKLSESHPRLKPISDHPCSDSGQIETTVPLGDIQSHSELLESRL